MRINVQDDTFKDVNNLSLVVNNNTLEDNSSSGKSSSNSRTFAQMVERDDIIAVVKAYIQEEKGCALELMVGPDDTIGDVKAVIKKYEEIRFHKYKLTLYGTDPDDSEYLDDLRIQNESVTVDQDGTIGDVKATIYEKVGIRFRKQRLIFRGKECGDSELLSDLGMELDSELILRLI
uniref:Ubiquitin-like domain-containing protein n=1 Tax=Nicotiana tabacum TaxID=4097 RepID=A0A1S4DFF1_TOBAC|nr:PREDICTED: uncharacterized protein LOC107829044 [Nicotiana tabacum]